RSPGQDADTRARLVVDAKGRTTNLRWVSHRAGTFTRERRPCGAAQNNQTGEFNGRRHYVAKRRPLMFGRILSALLLSSVMLAQTKPVSIIKFEDATAASGIQFTHSFGSQKLGSLLEGTGGGCVWFDYNNDGKPDLYVTSGRPLDDAMHPYPLK